jgi:hypothetical protein
MKWLKGLAGILSAFVAIGIVRDFFSKKEIWVVDKNEIQEDMSPKDITSLKPDYSQSMDMRGTPTHVCPCGSDIWHLKVVFDNFEIATYFLDMECANCGSLATAPTPVDREIQE